MVRFSRSYHTRNILALHVIKYDALYVCICEKFRENTFGIAKNKIKKVSVVKCLGS